MYSMIMDESNVIRKHSVMRYATRSTKELDRGDAAYHRSLDTDRGVADMLRSFEDTTMQIKDCLNKQFRNQFFRNVRERRESSRDPGRSLRESTTRESRYRDEREDYRKTDRRSSRRDDDRATLRDELGREERREDRYSSRRDEPSRSRYTSERSSRDDRYTSSRSRYDDRR